MNTLKENSLSIIIACIFITALVLISYVSGLLTLKTEASTYAGGRGVVSTSSQLGLNATTATTLIATTTCVARIITTKSSAILLTFSDYNNASPSSLYGHLQPASTTVAYDSGQYGCGKVKAYSMTADNITISEIE